MTSPLPFLTADLPGTGGVLKQRPEDFLVDEQPLYEPSGEGEHLYLFVEKKQATTPDVARRLAKAFRVKRGAVAYGGMKDKHAVTRQHFSVHLPGTSKAEDSESLQRFAEYPYAQVLWAERHGNKLRRGHHGGNRFVIKVRDVEPTAALRARPIVERLARQGFPNYFGDQRFGYRLNSHTLGQLLLTEQHEALLNELLGRPLDHESEHVQAARQAYEAGDYDLALQHMPKSLRGDRQALDALRQGKTPAQAVRQIEQLQRDFFVSALQSAAFNLVVDRRLRDGTFDRLIEGDLAWKHDSRACFAVDDETAAADNGPDGRVSNLDVSPSGPLWGDGMTRAAGEVDAMERDALAAFDVSPEHFEQARGVKTSGSRRPIRQRLIDPDFSGGADEHGPYLRLSFQLDRGSFATMAVREITKI